MEMGRTGRVDDGTADGGGADATGAGGNRVAVVHSLVTGCGMVIESGGSAGIVAAEYDVLPATEPLLAPRNVSGSKRSMVGTNGWRNVVPWKEVL